MRAIALFSGGKDSTFALHIAVHEGFEIVRLLTVVPPRRDSMLFHTPFTQFVELQAESMGIPIEVAPIDSEEELAHVLKKIARETRATHLVVGALLSDFQRIRFACAAYEAGLRVFNPLWRKDQARYLMELVEWGIEAMIVSITAYGLPLTWLGRVIDRELAREIVERARRYGFNPAFEGGEAETFVVNAPLFRRRICVDYEVIKLSEFEGFVKPLRVYLC